MICVREKSFYTQTLVGYPELLVCAAGARCERRCGHADGEAGSAISGHHEGSQRQGEQLYFMYQSSEGGRTQIKHT